MLKQEIANNPFTNEPIELIISIRENEETGFCIKELKTGNIYGDKVAVPVGTSVSNFEETDIVFVDPTSVNSPSLM